MFEKKVSDMSISEMGAELETIDADMKTHELWALQYQAMATTGTAKMKKLAHGTNGPEFSPEEKVKDCLSISERHIENRSILVERKRSIVYRLQQLAERKDGLELY